MRDFEMGDIIGYNSPEDGYVYCEIIDITEDELIAEDLGDGDIWYYVPFDKADYCEPVIIDEETVKKFARYEITAKDVIGDVFPPERIAAQSPYQLSIDELLTVLKKANGMPVSQFQDEWFGPIRYGLRNVYSYGHRGLYDAGTDGYRFLPSRSYYIWNAFQSIDSCVSDNVNDYSHVIEELEYRKALLSLPVPERQYDDKEKAHYIKNFDNEKMLDKATEPELQLFVQYVGELCARGNKTALYAKAYGCYGGNRAFPCDWCASRDALLKLTEMDENPFLANTLGYIFYYGRCTDGEPEYEKAFKYFSIGAAGYIYESRYKLADMFRHGYGVAKNNKIAASMIWELYDENIEYIFDGEFNCKFADVALRAGTLLKEGINCDANPDLAYFYYLQAEFAIRMRMIEDDHYGDVKVAEGIRSAIEEILPQTSFVKTKRTVNYRSLERVIAYQHKKHRLLEMKVRKLKNDEYSLTFRILPKDGEKYQPKFFATSPQAHFSGMLDTITAQTVNCFKIRIGGRILKNPTVSVIFDSIDGNELYMYGKKVAEIISDGYNVRYPAKEKAESFRFVSVKFPFGNHTYDYICEIPDVQVGDKVIVNTAQGESEVEVVRVFDKNSTETALPIAKYKSVVRKKE